MAVHWAQGGAESLADVVERVKRANAKAMRAAAAADRAAAARAWLLEATADPLAGTGREWTLDLGRQRPLSLNGPRGQYHAHARAVRDVRHAAEVLTRAAQIPPLLRVQIVLHYAPRDRRRRDPINLAATLKPVEDGITAAGVIPDDTPEYSEPTMPVIDDPTGQPGRLYVIVRELAPVDTSNDGGTT